MIRYRFLLLVANTHSSLYRLLCAEVQHPGFVLDKMEAETKVLRWVEAKL